MKEGKRRTQMAEMFGTPNLDGNGFTSAELGEHLGITQGMAVKKIREACSGGVLRHVGFRAARAIDGRKCRLPIYQITKEKQP